MKTATEIMAEQAAMNEMERRAEMTLAAVVSYLPENERAQWEMLPFLAHKSPAAAVMILASAVLAENMSRAGGPSLPEVMAKVEEWIEREAKR